MEIYELCDEKLFLDKKKFLQFSSFPFVVFRYCGLGTINTTELGSGKQRQ